ncbi:hypothetical protein FQR65_LT20385 [Abscondita terminalis]|nr:hypothetical protein FQR65_LT20385 [Abscondita terminalis]
MAFCLAWTQDLNGEDGATHRVDQQYEMRSGGYHNTLSLINNPTLRAKRCWPIGQFSDHLPKPLSPK